MDTPVTEGGTSYQPYDVVRRKLDEANDKIFSLEGVIKAVDRVLDEARVVHASRAMAVKIIVEQREPMNDGFMFLSPRAVSELLTKAKAHSEKYQ